MTLFTFQIDIDSRERAEGCCCCAKAFSERWSRVKAVLTVYDLLHDRTKNVALVTPVGWVPILPQLSFFSAHELRALCFLLRTRSLLSVSSDHAFYFSKSDTSPVLAAFVGTAFFWSA